MHARPGEGKVIFTTCAYPNPKALIKAMQWKEHLYVPSGSNWRHAAQPDSNSTETTLQHQHREKK